MNNLLKLGKKIFTVGVVATTIFWSLGVAALIPAVANAATAVDCATLVAGDMVKVDGKAAIWAVNADKTRSYFPNGDIYKSWTSNNVYTFKTVSGDCMASLQAVGAIFARPGTFLVKESATDKLYVTLPGNKLAEISADAAKALYGASYATTPAKGGRLLTMDDATWVNYSKLTMGTKVTEVVPTVGSMVSNAGKYYVVDANKTLREVTATGLTANSFQTKFAFALSDVTGYVMGTAVTAQDAVLSDRTQGAVGTGVVITTPSTTIPVGALTLSLSADTPAGTTLPLGATNVDVLKLNAVNAGATDAILDEVIIKRSGVGAVTGLTAYLYDGNARVGTGKTFASDTNEAVFSALNKTVKAGATLKLSVRLQVGATATTGNHALTVSSAKLASGTVSGAFPLVGSTFSVNSGITAGSVTIAGNGTLSAPVVGDVGASVAQFKLTAGTEDMDLNSFTLKQDGTLSTDLLSNFALYQGSTKVDATVAVNSRLVTFTLTSPLRILNGANKIFVVKADVAAASDAAKTIVFFMDNDNDLKAVGASYGYGVSLTRTAYDAAASQEGQTLTLLGGGVTISNKSLAAHDAKVDSTEVELGKVAILAKSDTVEIQKMTLTIATTKVASTSANTGDWGLYHDVNDGATMDSGDTILLRNIKLKDIDTGRTIGSAKAITDCATITASAGDVDIALTCTYTDYFTVAKGTTKNVAVVADINSAQISGVIYTATLDFSSASVFTIKDSKDVTVTDIVPASAIASNAVTTRSSALTLSRATTPESRTVVKGSTTDALGIIATAGAGTGNDVKLSALTLSVYVDAALTTDANDGTFADSVENTVNANELVTEVNLYVGDTKIAGPASVDSDGNVIFTSSKFVGGYYTIPAGSTKTIVARATVSGNAPYGTGANAPDAFAFTFAAGDVTVEDGTGTTFTPTVTGTNINGTTSPSVAITVSAGGTITTAADTGKPLAKVLLANATEQEVHRIKLTATKETFTVDKLAVGVSSAASTYDNVQYLKLYDTNGVALSEAVGLDANGTSTFSGLNIQVPVAGATVVVKAMLNPVGERTTAAVATAGIGSDTGDTLTFALDTVSSDFHAQGGSGTVDTAADAAVSNSYQVVKTAPVIAVLSLPSTVLTADTVTLFKFSVTADANEDVTLARVTPYVTFSDSDGGNELKITAGTVKIYDMAAPSTVIGTSAVTTVSTTGAYAINLTSSTLPTIAKGTTKTFEVRGDVTGVETSDSISVKMVQDASALSDATVATGDNATVQYTVNNFVWSDNGADTDGFTSTEWMNSFLLPGWDSNSKTVSKS